MQNIQMRLCFRRNHVFLTSKLARLSQTVFYTFPGFESIVLSNQLIGVSLDCVHSVAELSDSSVLKRNKGHGKNRVVSSSVAAFCTCT